MDSKTIESKGYYCTKCNTLCELHNEGISSPTLGIACTCPHESIDEIEATDYLEWEYPDTWIPVTVKTLIQFDSTEDDNPFTEVG